MEIVIYRRQRAQYGEQNDTTCLVPKFVCCVAGLSEFFLQRFSNERSIFKGLGAAIPSPLQLLLILGNCLPRTSKYRACKKWNNLFTHNHNWNGIISFTQDCQSINYNQSECHQFPKVRNIWNFLMKMYSNDDNFRILTKKSAYSSWFRYICIGNQSND